MRTSSVRRGDNSLLSRGFAPCKGEDMDFTYPVEMWYFGRPYTFTRFVIKDGKKYAVYAEKELGIEQAFDINLFKYHEAYGNIERSAR